MNAFDGIFLTVVLICLTTAGAFMIDGVLKNNIETQQQKNNMVSVNDHKSGFNNMTDNPVTPYVYKCGGTHAEKNNCEMILKDIKKLNDKLEDHHGKVRNEGGLK